MQYNVVAIELRQLYVYIWRITVTEINDLIYEGGPTVASQMNLSVVYSLNKVQKRSTNKIIIYCNENEAGHLCMAKITKSIKNVGINLS